MNNRSLGAFALLLFLVFTHSIIVYQAISVGDSTYLSSVSMNIIYDPADATGLLTLNITINTSTSNPVEIVMDNPFEASVNLSLISVNSEQGGNVVVDYSADNITVLFNNTSWVELSFTIDNLMESTAPGIYTTYLDLTGYNDVSNFSLTLQIPSGYTVEVAPSLGASVEYGEPITVTLTKPLLYTIVVSTPISTTTTTTSPITTTTTFTTSTTTTTSPVTTLTATSLTTTPTTTSSTTMATTTSMPSTIYSNPPQTTSSTTNTATPGSVEYVPVLTIAVILIVAIVVVYLLVKTRR